ncbi:VOC family protein [Sphingobium baderi]|uniref:VOC domain-containing protein n=1 Tax=Sphingobium baderi LL03 TaxID=1114964 RepID=T0GPU0_9SPHN|nr:VOC family protein [Sphingobium baderi]EQB05891.1 hypothetical protein L485_01750 [Sphingobium baderi LL03]KMS60474.1 hypothetical protein V475_19230 [Sphingobium baderi LL03]WRD75816.1 VOC family protein [Sphingobium baderi]
MIAPFDRPALGNIMQVAWVTPDLDRSLGQFKGIYRIPEFLVMEQRFPADVFGQAGEMSLRLALANVDHMQIELIQPLGGGVDSIYRDVLPADGGHANVFHHVCVKINGSLAEWDAHVAGLGPDQPIVYTGDVGPDARFLYTDQRDTLGIYVEHVWFGPDTEARMAAVPTYRTL